MQNNKELENYIFDLISKVAGDPKVLCKECKGIGIIYQNQETIFGKMMTQVLCPHCKGKGQMPLAVDRNTSMHDLGLDNYQQKVKLANAINNYLNLSIDYSSISNKNVGDFIDSLPTQFNCTKINKYVDLPTKKVQELANSGDREACLELSHRYTTGTTLLNRDDSLADYWKSKADEQSEIAMEATSNLTEQNNEDYNMEYNKKYEWAITPDKNKHEYVIGIDFGHGETSAAYCSIGWDSTKGQLSAVKDIDFGSNNKVIPSAISITTDDKAYIGDAAFLPEVLNKAEAKVCFKKKPEDINGESERLMMRFMKEVYKTIRERNSALFTEGNHLVYIPT